MSGLPDSDTLHHLTNTLNSLSSLSFVSLRIWYEEGQLKFFFTNLPPRNTRKPEQHPMRADQRVEKDKAVPSPVKTRGRVRKRQCASTPDNQFVPPDQLRRGSSASTGSLQVSGLDLPRESVSSVSIPCSNQFEVLATLSGFDPDTVAVHDAGPPEKCPRCVQPLQVVSAIPDFPCSSAGVNVYSCGHREFKEDTFACDDCQMMICFSCLGNEAFRRTVSSPEIDQFLREKHNAKKIDL